MLQDGPVAMASLQFLQQQVRTAFVQDVRKEKIVQDHHARRLLQKRKHVLMKGRIAEMIEDAIEFAEMRSKPANAPQPAMRRDPGVVDLSLVADDVDVIPFVQHRQQVCAVGADAATFGRKRRHIGQPLARPFRERRRGGRLAFDNLGNRRDRALRRFVPGEPCGLRRAVPLQFGRGRLRLPSACCIFAAMAPSSRGSNSASVRPTTSGRLELFDAMTALPHCMASTVGKPKPSWRLGNTNSVQPLYRASRSFSGT